MFFWEKLEKYNQFVAWWICMKDQSLFSGENWDKIINLSSAEFAQGVVKVKCTVSTEIYQADSYKFNKFWQFYECSVSIITDCWKLLYHGGKIG